MLLYLHMTPVINICSKVRLHRLLKLQLPLVIDLTINRKVTHSQEGHSGRVEPCVW